MGERIFRQSVADLIYPEMRELVRAHQRRGHTVVLSSSALTNQVAPVARYLGIEHIVCNRLVADEQGILTGEIEQPVVWGPTKASGVQQFAADHQVDLGSSYFYADGDEDLSLMCLVGHPRPTNPGPMLTKVAVRRGWPIMRFSSRGSGGPLGVARRLASVSSLGPLAAAALGVGLAAAQQARRGQLPHQVLAGDGPRAERRQAERDGRGAPDRAAARGLPVQPPQQRRRVPRGRAGQGQLDRGRHEGAGEQPRVRPAREAARRRVRRPRGPGTLPPRSSPSRRPPARGCRS